MSPSSFTVPCNITDTYKHKDSVLQTWAGPSRLEHGLAVRSLVPRVHYHDHYPYPYHHPLIDHYRYHRRRLGQQHLQQQAQHHQQRRAATSAILAQQRAAQFNMIIIRVARRWCCNRQRPCVRARQCERQSPCTAYGPCTCQCRENGCSPHSPMPARQCHRRQRHRENVNEWQFVQNGEESEDDDLD